MLSGGLSPPSKMRRTDRFLRVPAKGFRFFEEAWMKVFLWVLLFVALWGFFRDFWAAVIAGVFLLALLAPKPRSK